MSGQSTHPFTCNTCQVAFRSSDLQRTHMQSDWHRYNLKRRVASLPPLSSDIFNEKVLANRATAAETAARASFEKVCGPCKKTFFSENAFANHLSSKTHKTNVGKAATSSGKKEDDSRSIMSSTFSLGEPAEKSSTADDLDSDAEEEFQEVIEGMKDSTLADRSEPVSRRPTRPHHSAADGDSRPEHPLSPASTKSTSATSNGRIRQRDSLKECLFCSRYQFESLSSSLEHMVKAHGLFIPESNYIADMEGLVKYLNQKVNEEHQCLYCGRLKWSEDGIKTHMRDARHCKIAYETEDAQLEIGQFYDFRSTYSDEEEDWSDDDDDEDEDEDEDMSDGGAAPGGGVKLGARRAVKTDNNGGDEDIEKGEDAGWETDSTNASSVPTEELGRVYLDDQRDEVKQRLRQNKHHNHSSASSRHRSTDGFHSHAHATPHAVYHDEVELHLPSGRSVGHRSLNKIWRQNLRTYPTPEEREQRLLTASDEMDEDKDVKPSEAARERERGRGGALMRRNESTGLMGLDDAQKRQVVAREMREMRTATRKQRRFEARVGEKEKQPETFP